MFRLALLVTWSFQSSGRIATTTFSNSTGTRVAKRMPPIIRGQPRLRLNRLFSPLLVRFRGDDFSTIVRLST
eukprot:m.470561 g.470561  ORF g.470561 m.470561 type:complete len:72 (+) comp57099_c0_seq4:1013-1228(+)